MHQLSDLIEQLAAAVVMADPLDLTGLAELHSKFQDVQKCEPDEIAAADVIDRARKSAGGAEKLVERIILQEVDDAGAAIKELNKLVDELQRIANGTFEQLNAPANEPAPAVSSAASHDVASQDQPQQPFSAEDAPMIVEFVNESREHIAAAEAEVLKLQGSAQDTEAIAAIFRSFHTMKGVAGFLNLKQIGALAHAAENLLDLARKGQLALDGVAVELILEAIDAAKFMLNALDVATRENKSPVSFDGLKNLISRLDACASGEHTSTGGSASATAIPASVPMTQAGAQTSAQKFGAPSADATVKVATDRLDSLINMVGELVITQSMVRQETSGLDHQNQRLTRNLSRLDKITRELQDLSMSMRMVPIQGVFQKMTRLVRDLSRKFGKQIELNLVGGETELDRNVVEAIGDPLVHMVRNAADHGIDTPEQRAAAGKSPTGHIELRAAQQAGKIVIEIKDDGKGLNKARILKKAIDAGIVKEGEHLSDPEIFQLIFHAGLSTAEKVTDVSGRGVGMDVVRKNIENLRGHIEIQSVEGEGSTFTISLPLTLAVIDGLVVRVGSERYIVPITSIEQSIRPKHSQLSTVHGRGEMCMVRGQVLPLFRLYELFDVKPITEDPTQALVVIVHDNHRKVCLQIDELLGQQQVVIKSLGETMGHVRGISGGAILGDGSVSLILDIPGIIDLAGAAATKPTLSLAA